MRKTSRIKYREVYSGGRVGKTGLEVKISRLQTALKSVFITPVLPATGHSDLVGCSTLCRVWEFTASFSPGL
jgi:hypothetical protein